MWKSTKELEQALNEVQSEKCKIQEFQESLLDQLDDQQEDNAKLTQKLHETQQELAESHKVIKMLQKEIVVKEEDSVEMFMIIEKMQQEMQDVTSVLQEQDKLIATRNAHLHALQTHMEASRKPRNIDEIMKILDTTRSSDV